MGRTARGVKAVQLGRGDEVVAADVIDPETTVLTITQKGYGKRTPVNEYPVQHRGGRGVLTIKTSDRNGPVVRVLLVQEDDELMVIANGGKMLRTRASDVSIIGRNTQGVRIMDLDGEDRVVSVDAFGELDLKDEEDSPEEPDSPDGGNPQD